jgi:hypothetical protein
MEAAGRSCECGLSGQLRGLQECEPSEPSEARAARSDAATRHPMDPQDGERQRDQDDVVRVG